MARKTRDVTIALADGNRDNGKMFRITEMPAVRAEKWATRALLAMAKSGAEVPDEALQAGAASLLGAGIQAFTRISFLEAEPLLDEMMGCVEIVPDPSRKDVVRPLIDDDIEEVATRLFLRGEVVDVHTGFSMNAAMSRLGQAAKEADSSSPTPTSPKSSEPS